MFVDRHGKRILKIDTTARPTAEDLKRRMLSHGDKVLATAVVGTPYWRVVVAGVRASGRENIEFFSEEDPALQWLVTR